MPGFSVPPNRNWTGGRSPFRAPSGFSFCHAGFLSPLRGLTALCVAFPRLTPWAVFFRRFAAGAFILEA
jgi:hypothetical protein